MQDAVLDKDISIDDAGGVGEDGAVGGNSDRELFAVHSRQGGVVGQGRAIADRALHDVVLQDRSELVVGDSSVGTASSEALEGVVVRAEDCYVGKAFESRDEVGLNSSASKSGEVAKDKGFGQAERDG